VKVFRAPDNPIIKPEDRNRLHAIAKSFNETDLQPFITGRDLGGDYGASEGSRPGDDFNRHVSWHDILEPEGWAFVSIRRSDSAELWRRPGKTDRGISATIRTIEGQELFHCFSSNAAPLPERQSITKFTAYAILHHGGDFEAAARDLGRQGYGEPPRSVIDINSAIYARRGDDIPWSNENPFIYTRVSDFCDEVKDAPSIPFESEPPNETSIWHELIDPLEIQLFENEEDLRNKEIKREKKKRDEKRKLELARGPAFIIWRDFGDAPKLRKTKEGRIKVRAESPRGVSWHLLNDRFASKNNIRTLHYQHGEFMLWNGERYRRLKIDDVRPIFSNFLTYCAEFDGIDKNGKAIYKPYKVKKNRVEEIVLTMKDMTHLDGDLQDPCWLSSEIEQDMPDHREIVCCKNGLLDIKNRKLIEPTAAFYSFNSTGIVFDQDADEPKLWNQFLDSSLDKESQLLLQQWFGYCLVQDTRLQKMLMVVGKPGSGKGTAMTMLQEVVGLSSVCSMDFDRMNGNFALSIALGKSLMMFPDARQGYRMDSKGSVVGNILSITGEDALLVDRKNMKPVTQKLNTRIVVVSNDIINLSDATGALNRRMLWIKFPGFIEKEDPDLKEKLRKELSGILNWAIDGWHSLMKKGEFIQPESAIDFMEAFQEQASPIKKFIEDMCNVDNGLQAHSGEMFEHWSLWRKIMGYKQSTSNSAFGKMLISADMSITKGRKKKSDGSLEYIYKGIELSNEKIEQFVSNSVGESRWRSIKEEASQKSLGDIVSIAEYLMRSQEL